GDHGRLYVRVVRVDVAGVAGEATGVASYRAHVPIGGGDEHPAARMPGEGDASQRSPLPQACVERIRGVLKLGRAHVEAEVRGYRDLVTEFGHGQAPPVTSMTAPVVKEASSDSSQR